MNPLCEDCPINTICKRHGIPKSKRKVEQCKGIANVKGGGVRQWNKWEKLYTKDPQLDPPGFEEPSNVSQPSNAVANQTVQSIDKGIGPGSELKKLLGKVGIHATPNCKCNKYMREMNDKGPDWCEQNIETIVDWMQEEAKKRHLPFIRIAGKRITVFAIKKGRKKYQK